MPGRVLNFFEFSDKYSSTEATEKDLQDVTSAASNFAEINCAPVKTAPLKLA